MTIREVRRYLFGKNVKKVERYELMVLEKFWELGGGILQFFSSDALVVKSEVFLSVSIFLTI